jgi:methionine aminotransferase
MSKLPNIGTSIFTVMSKMAAENNAINLSGFPNFPVDDRLTNILAPHKECTSIHQCYPPLLSKIAALIKKSHNRIVSPETDY